MVLIKVTRSCKLLSKSEASAAFTLLGYVHPYGIGAEGV